MESKVTNLQQPQFSSVKKERERKRDSVVYSASICFQFSFSVYFNVVP